ncbi:flagellar basal body rod protein FlgC [Rhizobacter sp. P5_C2]|jgi:flagellar basal-body rod protein FlgC
MDYRAAFQISAAGMAVEKLRVDTTALNLANMHTTARTEAGLYKPLTVITQAGTGFAGLMDAAGAAAAIGALPQAQVVATPAAPRLVHEPGHPYADEHGMVAYPGIDHTAQMVTLMTALRSYEANVAAAGVTRALAARALEIGGRQS